MSSKTALTKDLITGETEILIIAQISNETSRSPLQNIFEAVFSMV
jgi:hypothetical protein